MRFFDTHSKAITYAASNYIQATKKHVEQDQTFDERTRRLNRHTFREHGSETSWKIIKWRKYTLNEYMCWGYIPKTVINFVKMRISNTYMDNIKYILNNAKILFKFRKK